MADTPSSSTTPKPKAFRTRTGVVRKTKAERDEYVKQEAERAAARATAAANANVQIKTAPSKQTERRTRDIKHKDGHPATTGGSGVFGAGVSSRAGSLRKTQDAGRSEMLEGQEATSTRDQLKGDRPNDVSGDSGKRQAAASSNVPAEELGYDLEHAGDDEPKKDINEIWISSDEDDDDNNNNEDNDEDDDDILIRKGKSRAVMTRPLKSGLGLRPVRAVRVSSDHQKPQDSSLKSPRKQSKRVNIAQEDLAVSEDDDEDVEDENDYMDIDDDTIPKERSDVKYDAPSSPELLKRKPTKRSITKSKDSKRTTETAEEREERLRLNVDIRKMKDEFVVLPKMLKAKQQKGQLDDGEKRLLLFQLPPLVPFLTDSKPSAAAASPVMPIKSDPDELRHAAEADKNAARSTHPGPKFQNDGFLTAIEPTQLPAGRVGKLRVHKSGKVSLDWGGTDVELRYGTDVDFLQDAVLLQTPSQDPTGMDSNQGMRSQSGNLYALGQIKRKLVAIPDWQKLYD